MRAWIFAVLVLFCIFFFVSALVLAVLGKFVVAVGLLVLILITAKAWSELKV